MTYIITHNLIDGKEPVQVSAEAADRYPHRFRLYDDDGELYFEGRSMTNDDAAAFTPLDVTEGAYGCTEIRYLYGDVWEQL